MARKKSKIVIDTNVLIEYPDIIDKYDQIILPAAVLEEIDNCKKSREIGHMARSASRKILANRSKIKFIIKDKYDMPADWDPSKLDNKIVMCAKENGCALISNDLNVRIKAEGDEIGVKAEGYMEDTYTGIKHLRGNSKTITKFFKNPDMLENQYIIVYDEDTNEEVEMIYRNGIFEPLILPHPSVIEPRNAEQKCSMDLMLRQDIPIKIITGVTGSGKTKISVELAYHLMEEKVYSNMVFIRNPIGSGEEIGALPGDFEAKTWNFYVPLIQNLGEEVVDYLIDKKKLTMEIPFYMKGSTKIKTAMLVDEAEDLDLKTLRLIGTRCGENSIVVFSGDYQQVEGKFAQNNGVNKLIKELKGNPLVGIVNLPTDVRSSASSVIALL